MARIAEKMMEATRKLSPSHKTVLTVAWIMVSIMIGEFIIYNHQSVFSSYVISASDFTTIAGVDKNSNREGRDHYEKQINSSENFYKKILSRYTREDGTEAQPDKTLRAVRQQRPAFAVTAVSKAPAARPAASVSKVPKFVVHKVKSGETLTKISKDYFKTTSKYKTIAKQNKLSEPYSLKAGEKLIIMLD